MQLKNESRFIEDLKNKGYLKETITPDGSSKSSITAKTERAIRKNALNQIFFIQLK